MSDFKQAEPNHIMIFPNRRKTKGNQPDWTGQLVDKDGVVFNVALWKLRGKTGIYFGGQISNRQEAKEKYGKNKNTDEQKPTTDLNDLPY